MSKINLIIADDHPLIRVGIVNIIKPNNNFNIIGEASNGKEALDMIFDLRPDIAILDIEMPVMNGLNVCVEVRKEQLKTKILFLTMLKEEEVYKQAMSSGANGYLLKDNAPEELEKAITALMKGETYTGEKIENYLVNTKSRIITDTRIAEQINRLTKTEKDILLLIAQNISSKEIAAKLFISDSTVKNHRHNIVKKLELESDQNSLLKFAIQNSMFLK